MYCYRNAFLVLRCILDFVIMHYLYYSQSIMDQKKFKYVSKRWHQIDNTSLPMQVVPAPSSTYPVSHVQV